MSPETIAANLERARRDLLELTTRTRLLDTPRHRERSRTVEVIDELSDEIFRILVREQRTMVFDPREEVDDDDNNGESALFDRAVTDEDAETFGIDESADPEGLAARYTDNRLQTPYPQVALQKRLLSIYFDAGMYEEEHGVNILYLALGFLRWFDAESSDRQRHAPLILLPVQLERQSANRPFKLSLAGDEISTNLSLQAKLASDFGLELPVIDDVDEFVPSEYCRLVAEVVGSQSRWEVLPNDMQLGFFSFTKFLMYRDLDPANWPENARITEHPLIKGLLGTGFEGAAPLVGDDEKVESLLDPVQTCHILDADSSQAVTIEEVRQGRNLVIQGPPGTGKSQTIANLIAAAVKGGRTVLFVAEKMAALSVVKRRLDNIQLGEMCLELHSHKAQKRTVLDELQRTLHAGKPTIPGATSSLDDLIRARDALNAHAERLHQPFEPARISPYRLLGEYVRLITADVAAPTFGLDQPTQWTHDQFKQRRVLVGELISCLDTLGSPQQCIWRGVGLSALLPTDLSRIRVQSRDACENLIAARDRAAQLAAAMKVKPPQTLAEAAQLAKLGLLVGAAPEMEHQRLADPIWPEQREEIDKLVEAGMTLRRDQAELCTIIVEAGWQTDVTMARTMLAAHGRSWLRIFSREYRRASALLRGIVTGEPPRTVADRIALLDRLIACQCALELLKTHAQLGRQAFGALFRGIESDWDRLAAIVRWERTQSQGEFAKYFRSVLATVTDCGVIRDQANKLAAQLQAAWLAIQQVEKNLTLNVVVAFDKPDLRQVEVERVRERFECWANTDETPANWISYRTLRDAGAGAGLKELVEQLGNGRIRTTEALDQFDLAYYDALMRRCLETIPELARFRGQSHEQIVERFRALDRERIALARHEVALAHYQSVPRHASDVGALGLVRREIEKRRKLLPLRQLIRQAGPAIQAIKPVFMMSPLSVAQYLEPGALEFDLLLIDEASQVRPVDALGAVARARQMVVVGDDKQLPPTTFFAKFADDGDDSEEPEEFTASDIESILGLCRAQSVSSRMLSWHYRSKHHTLIAVSNREYYDSRLYVIPSPSNENGKLGLRFHHVTDTVFDRGGTASNRGEAEAVAQAVIEHACNHPDLSLGVGTFSVRQRDEIRFAIERLRRSHPEAEPFFASSNEEPFFVKNLETIQGDERAVILISVGYGRDRSGVFTMNFGPLSAQGGERRLNVLITRARRRCEVFSSITDEDIDLSRARGLGPRGLKMFLQYARTENLDIGIPTGKDFDSPFEQAVAVDLERAGYAVEPQVGVAGFFIDIGVRDPERPGRYLLGVECDGARYHSARWARDRDRLRQAILEDRGWTIHRIWSADWFHDRPGQLRRLLDAIERAKTGPPDAPPVDNNPGPTLRIVRANDDEHRSSRTENVAVPYKAADFKVRLRGEIHEVGAVTLVPHVVRIVTIEEPIHGDEIARRLTTLTGKQRTGSRITSAIEQAIGEAVRHRKLFVEDGFYTTKPNLTPVIRDRTNAPATVRKPEFLPPSEIRAAIEACVERNFRVDFDTLVRWVARTLGFGSTSQRLAGIVSGQIDLLARGGHIQCTDGTIRRPPTHANPGSA